MRLVLQRLEQSDDAGDTSTRDRCSRLKGAVKKAKEKPPPENVLALFFNALDDHSRAELLWHRDSRAELRAAIDAELRDLTQEGGAAGAGGSDFAWNHQEFRVAYPSLEAELRIGHYFLRLLLEESEKSGHVTLTDPKPFFDALYLRALRETKTDLKAMCLEAMALLYKDYKDVIGTFPDTQCVRRPRVLRVCIVGVAFAICKRDGLHVIVRFASARPLSPPPSLPHPSPTRPGTSSSY